MMTLSSSTWLMSALPGNKGFYTIEQCLDTMRAAGFEYMDANLWSLSGRNRPAGQDNWKEWVSDPWPWDGMRGDGNCVAV